MAEPQLELIQSMLQRVLDNQRQQSDDIRSLTLRVASIEQRLGLMSAEIAGIHGDIAGI